MWYNRPLARSVGSCRHAAVMGMIVAFSVGGHAAESAAVRPWIKPAMLRPGDTIMIVAPGSPPDRKMIEAAATRFRALGLHVRIPADLYRTDTTRAYLAGTDSQRADELNRALRDPKIAAIFAARGGYGLTRILDRIDYQALRKHPKLICGYSDITALHLAIARRARVVTFHSPMPQSSLWRDDGDYRYSAKLFWHQVFRPKGAAAPIVPYTVPLPAAGPKPIVVVGGKAEGRLIGGNLTLICATLGTPYSMDAHRKILFVEDTGEAAYRVDRMFSQLRLAGILDQISGLIVGSFDDTDQEETECAIRSYVARLRIPVVMRFPVGHTPLNATLPYGVRAELDANRCTLRILESPVTTR